jgi:hypothetical protein
MRLLSAVYARFCLRPIDRKAYSGKYLVDANLPAGEPYIAI